MHNSMQLELILSSVKVCTPLKGVNNFEWIQVIRFWYKSVCEYCKMFDLGEKCQDRLFIW